MLDPVAVAIPFFFLLIAVEAAVARVKARPVYHLADALTDLGCGVTDQVGAVFFEALTLALWVGVYDHVRLGSLSPTSPWTWVVALLGVDLCYYLWHRASHRVNLIWATHVVHHQSDEYNLAVALRQAVFAGLTSWPFYLPLALLGVPPEVYVASRAFNLLYQFWIHTRLVGRLGPLEWVLNTPSHHRVHHGINRAYLDTNFAGVLIVWDRMFGTFTPEVGEPVYGTVRPYRSWSPLWAQLDGWAHLVELARATPRWADKLRVFVAPPEWSPPGVTPYDPNVDAATLSRPPYPPVASGPIPWILLQWLPLAAVLTTLLATRHLAPTGWLVAGAAWCLWTLGSLTGLLQGKAWARPSEVVRLLVLAAGLGLLARQAGLV